MHPREDRTRLLVFGLCSADTHSLSRNAYNPKILGMLRVEMDELILVHSAFSKM